MSAILAHVQVLVAAAAVARSVERDASPSTALMMVNVCAAPCAMPIVFFFWPPHCLTRGPPCLSVCEPIAGGQGCRLGRGERTLVGPPCHTHPYTGTQISILSAPACAQPHDDAIADDETVRVLLERGGVADYVQLKDLAVVLAKRAPACYARLCFKPGTLVASNAALVAAVGRVAGVQVRAGPATLPGGVQARGVLRGYRIVTETPCSMQLVRHPVGTP